MKDNVLCLGELLMRISPTQDEQASKNPFKLYIGGAEANTATALAAWNVPVKYCTALPDNFASQQVIKYLQQKGIDTALIHHSGTRIGLYFLDRGADLKSSVVYDRAGSSFSELKRGMIDWDEALKDISWLNLTAISPAINADVADVCLEALEAASAKNITISIDLNYRSRLWKYGKDPLEVMPALVAHCDLIMGNIWAANTLLNVSLDAQINDLWSKKDYLEHSRATSQEIMQRFPRCKHVGNTFRFDSDSSNLLYYTTLFSEGEQYHSPVFSTKSVVDRSGSGDCFMAGLIYGFYNGHKLQDIVDFAATAAFGKLQEEGDSTQQDIQKIIKSISEPNKG